MRFVIAVALFLLAGAGFSAPLMAQDGEKKDVENKEAEAKPITYKAGIDGMT